MKRHGVSLLVVVAAALLLAACSKPRPLALGEKDSGRTIGIAARQELVVEVPSNATTGFRWIVVAAGPFRRIGESVYKAPRERGVVGAGGTETFRFRADARGSGELRLEYRRPWEKSVAAEKTWTVAVTVK